MMGSTHVIKISASPIDSNEIKKLGGAARVWGQQGRVQPVVGVIRSLGLDLTSVSWRPRQAGQM
jgi:hypothetical protein